MSQSPALYGERDRHQRERERSMTVIKAERTGGNRSGGRGRNRGRGTGRRRNPRLRPAGFVGVSPPAAGKRGDAAVDSISSVIERVSGASVAEIERVMAELANVRDMLRSEGERVQREISGYASLSQAAMTSMKIIGDSLVQWKSQTPPAGAAQRLIAAEQSKSENGPNRGHFFRSLHALLIAGYWFAATLGRRSSRTKRPST